MTRLLNLIFHRRPSIKSKIRLILVGYFIIAFFAFYSALEIPELDNSIADVTDWNSLYPWLFRFSALCILYGIWRPRIGDIGLLLMPLGVGALIRLVDFWYNFSFDPNNTLSFSTYTLASVGWLSTLISIICIDTLEYYIYNKLVEIEKRRTE